MIIITKSFDYFVMYRPMKVDRDNTLPKFNQIWINLIKFENLQQGVIQCPGSIFAFADKFNISLFFEVLNKFLCSCCRATDQDYTTNFKKIENPFKTFLCRPINLHRPNKNKKMSK